MNSTPRDLNSSTVLRQSSVSIVIDLLPAGVAVAGEHGTIIASSTRLVATFPGTSLYLAISTPLTAAEAEGSGVDTCCTAGHSWHYGVVPIAHPRSRFAPGRRLARRSSRPTASTSTGRRLARPAPLARGFGRAIGAAHPAHWGAARRSGSAQSPRRAVASTRVRHARPG